MILSPSRRENALGRALSLATLAALGEHEVRVFAPDDGPEWIGASQYEARARPVRSDSDLVEEVAALPVPIVAWVVKPLPSAVRLGEVLRGELGARVVLDVDDDDAALGDDFAAASPLNRLRLLRRPNLRPRRIRSALGAALAEGTPMTYSSDALAGALALPAAPVGLCVPHPRPLSPAPPGRAASDRGAADPQTLSQTVRRPRRACAASRRPGRSCRPSGCRSR